MDEYANLISVLQRLAFEAAKLFIYLYTVHIVDTAGVSHFTLGNNVGKITKTEKLNIRNIYNRYMKIQWI